MLLRYGEPAPRADALGHLGEAGRPVEERMPVGSAGFEQQHLHRRIGAQAIGKHAAGRAPAGDDVVVGFHDQNRGMESAPSTWITDPVANTNWPPASDATTSAMSSGVPQRRIGTRPSAMTL